MGDKTRESGAAVCESLDSRLLSNRALRRFCMRIELTLRSRHLFSLMAPRQPRKPVTMTIAPMAMTMLAADSEGNEGEKVAKLPCDTESQMPTPSSPQPHNCKEREHKVSKPTAGESGLVTAIIYKEKFIFTSPLTGFAYDIKTGRYSF